MMIQKKALGLAVLGSLSLGFAGNALATGAIQFDPDGAGGDGTVTVGNFDWIPGNALADNSLFTIDPGQLNPDGTVPGGATATGSFDLLAHSRLGLLNDSTGTPIFGNGLNSNYEITFKVKFTETGTFSYQDKDGNGVADFVSLDNTLGGGASFFEMFYDPSRNSNAAAGTGFDDGQLIASGSVISATGNFTSFQVPNGVPPNTSTGAITGADGYSLLDNVVPDGKNGQQTVDGTGSTNIGIDLAFTDPNFFISGVTGLILDMITNTFNNVPFTQTDPAAAFYGIAGLGVGPGVNPNLGTVNGLGEGTQGFLAGFTAGTDVQFQTDATSSFNPSSVPEPGMLSLLGLGIAALGFSMRCRQRG